MEKRRAGAVEWREAERVATGTLLKRYPALGDRAGDLARVAVEEAVRVWKGTAKLSTLATKIALRKAAKLAAKEIRAKSPPKPQPRRVLKLGEAAALAPVLKDFFEHHRLMLTNLLWDEEGPGEYMATSMRTLLPHLYEEHHVPERLRPRLTVDASVPERINTYVEKVKKLTPEGWIESADTLFTRPKIAGRPPPEPYLAGEHGPELQRIFREQAERNAGSRFHEKREAVSDAVIRFALECAGLSRTLQNRIMAPLRSVEAKENRRRSRAALEAVAEARRKGS